jgi:hypothetical protein
LEESHLLSIHGTQNLGRRNSLSLNEVVHSDLKTFFSTDPLPQNNFSCMDDVSINRFGQMGTGGPAAMIKRREGRGPSG